MLRRLKAARANQGTKRERRIESESESLELRFDDFTEDHTGSDEPAGFEDAKSIAPSEEECQRGMARAPRDAGAHSARRISAMVMTSSRL